MRVAVPQHGALIDSQAIRRGAEVSFITQYARRSGVVGGLPEVPLHQKLDPFGQSMQQMTLEVSQAGAWHRFGKSGVTSPAGWRAHEARRRSGTAGQQLSRPMTAPRLREQSDAAGGYLYGEAAPGRSAVFGADASAGAAERPMTSPNLGSGNGSASFITSWHGSNSNLLDMLSREGQQIQSRRSEEPYNAGYNDPMLQRSMDGSFGRQHSSQLENTTESYVMGAGDRAIATDSETDAGFLSGLESEDSAAQKRLDSGKYLPNTIREGKIMMKKSRKKSEGGEWEEDEEKEKRKEEEDQEEEEEEKEEQEQEDG